jgi:hypothetical protein
MARNISNCWRMMKDWSKVMDWDNDVDRTGGVPTSSSVMTMRLEQFKNEQPLARLVKIGLIVLYLIILP